MPSARLRDVAERARVSIRTVSNVVNGYAPVADATRQRVEAAVAELGYRPNLLARSLKSGRSGLLALVLPELDVPYFAELARAIIARARLHGYTVVIDQTDGDAERERELIMRQSHAAMFDAVILSPLALTASDLSGHDPRVPLVLLGERAAPDPHGRLGYDHVGIENVIAAREATAHLYAIGRRRVAAIGEQHDEAGETARQRLRGFTLAVADAGGTLDHSLVIGSTHFRRHDGALAMAALLAHPDGPPEAVFCFNDTLALGALRAIAEAGLRVPADIAVIGFDDTEDGRYCTPTLSTVAPDKQQIAQLAVDRLITRLADRAAAGYEPVELLARHRLIGRESTLGRKEAQRR